MLPKKIIEKYNVSTPRYTSYPTILDWNRIELVVDEAKSELKSSFNRDTSPISVYVHLPFCESLCTFCGCHKYITKNHEVEEGYINALIKEWEMYSEIAGFTPQVAEIHIGGGTPTFFSSENLKKLLSVLTQNTTSSVNFSFEGHPNHTTIKQLQILYNFGFRRVSFGVQDYNEKVQKAINRVQTFETVRSVTQLSRDIGYKSISHDLVFGLPFQTMECMEESMRKTLKLRPDNISLYSYAHVPWVKGTGQRGFSEENLPSGAEKRALYEFAKNELINAGYLEIGMDHFGLPEEPMTKAMINSKLKRNFMGYTTTSTNRLVGIGASAISEHDFGYLQNEKNVKRYQEIISNYELPVFKGHIHSKQDQVLKTHIHNLMCNLRTNIEDEVIKAKLAFKKSDLEDFIKDGVVDISENELIVTKEGKPFVRNVCMMIDPYNQARESKKFSKSV